MSINSVSALPATLPISLKNEISTENSASTSISRVFRGYITRKGMLDFQTAKVLKSSPFAQFFPAIHPTSSNPPILEKTEQWINTHPEELQELARKLIASINYVPHQEFMKSLIESVRSFNKYLDLLPDSSRSFTIVIPNKCPRPVKPYYRMSNLWVTMLALPYLKYPPKDIALIECASRWNTLKDISTEKYLMFDDASYSGNQISEIIEGIYNEESSKFPHFIVPFMTEASCAKIMKATKGKCWIANHRKMPTLREVFKKVGDLKIIVESHGGCPEGFAANLTLTYFDHKIGDAYSLSPLVSSGRRISSKESTSFIHEANTPYRQEEWVSRKQP